MPYVVIENAPDLFFPRWKNGVLPLSLQALASILPCRMLSEGERTEPLECGEPVCAGLFGCFAITNGHGVSPLCYRLVAA